jgi:hypothetical protein
VFPEASDGATYPGDIPGPTSEAGFAGLIHAMSFFLNNNIARMSTPTTQPTAIPAIAPADKLDVCDEVL